MKQFFLSFILCAAALVLPAYASEPVPLQGAFSVSETKQIKFATGNLQYTFPEDGGAGTWSFAEHQYDFIGEANVADGGLATTIDLFGWSGDTGSAKWGIGTSTTYADYSGEFMDWGKNIGDGETWRTLSTDEWKYLFETRANASSLYGVARINLNEEGTEYANGMILLPDNWQAPAGIDFKSGLASSYSEQAYADYQTLTLEKWQSMEANGAVFLPAAGRRIGESVYYVRYYGNYWSSSYRNNNDAYNVGFDSRGLSPQYDLSCYLGFSVRLVLDYAVYSIDFVNEDRTVLQSMEVPCYEMPVYTGETPTKEADAQYTYTFAGWTPELQLAKEDATYTAVFTETLNKYTVTFQNEDGTALQSTAVPYGETPAYNGETPTKPATAQYTYTFEGWDKDIVPVTGDATYTAVFTTTVNKYTITFKNEDGTALQSTAVPYGDTPAYNGDTPTKPATAQYTYTFEGWDKDIEEVTGDATYTAVFTETLNKYTITFQNEDGEILQSTAVPYGDTPAYNGDTPTKPATAQYTYTFKGWDKDIAPVTGDATYTAVFTTTVNEYTISAEATNGSVSGEGTYAYGTEIELRATPDAGYVFTRWSDDVTDNPRTIIVTEDATYTALFTEDAPTSMDAAGTAPTPRAQKVLRNGQVLILRDGKAYDLLGQEVR